MRFTFARTALVFTVFIAFTIAACASGSRKPAQAQEGFAVRCEKAIKQFLKKNSLDGGDRRQVYLVNAALNLAEFDLANRTRVSIADKKPSCERIQAMPVLETELSAKSEKIGDAFASLERFHAAVRTINEGIAIKDPDFPRNATCIATCTDERECIRRCKVSQQYLQDLSEASVLSMARFCVDYDKEVPNGLEIFEQLFNNYRPAILKAIAVGVKDTPPILARMTRVRNLLGGLLSKLQVARVSAKGESCPKPAPYPWLQTARDSIVFMTDNNSLGSGFHIKSSHDELRLVTAQHVVSADSETLDFDPRFFAISKAHSTNPPQEFSEATFTISPGLFDRGNDIFQAPASGNFTALEVIPESNIPMLKQRFHVAGFPGGSRDNFQMYDCTFVGFERSFTRNSDQMVYVMSCPGAPGSLKGMSGGPVLDDFGRVWGVVSDHSQIIGRVYVSPMSRDKRGGINMGFQTIFVTDNCLRDNMLGRKRCQVMPGAFSLVP